jgi:hypothetical protein
MCKIVHFDFCPFIGARTTPLSRELWVQRSVNMRAKMRFTSSLSRVA